MTWEEDLNRQLEHWTPSKEWRRWIYKAPAFFTDHNRDAFRPQTVSFGPYHHGEEQVKGMENLKKRSVLHFLKGSNKPIEDYLNALRPRVPELMQYYEHLDPEWEDTDKFLKVMFMDGCFMLDILINFGRRRVHDSNERRQFWRYAISLLPRMKYATIFDRSGEEYILRHIARDMLLIENQLPLLVFDILASIRFEGSQLISLEGITSIPALIQKFLLCGPMEVDTEVFHMLDVYQATILDRRMSFNRYYCSYEIMQSATKLQAAGIPLKKSKIPLLSDMGFSHGELRFPKIKVDSGTEVILLNLMAYELLHFGKGLEVVTYVSLFMSMVHTAEDVRLVQSMGIIENSLGSEEDVVKSFNTLSKAARSITLEYFFLYECPVHEVNIYYQQRMSTWRRRFREWGYNLRDTYFKNPWTSISVTAAAILLALTIVQTIYAIRSFNLDSNKK